MRILTYRTGGTDRAGVETGDGILDAAELLGEDSVRSASCSPAIGWGTLLTPPRTERRPRSSGEVELRPPVPDPEKIVCIGLNYRSHAEEAGVEPPEVPTFFAKFRERAGRTRRRGEAARGQRQGGLRG